MPGIRFRFSSNWTRPSNTCWMMVTEEVSADLAGSKVDGEAGRGNLYCPARATPGPTVWELAQNPTRKTATKTKTAIRLFFTLVHSIIQPFFVYHIYYDQPRLSTQERPEKTRATLLAQRAIPSAREKAQPLWLCFFYPKNLHVPQPPGPPDHASRGATFPAMATPMMIS